MVTFRDGDRAIAARNRTASDDELRRELDRMQALRQLAAAARPRGDARIYLRVASPPVSDGEAISEPCPAPSCAPIIG